MNLFFLALLSTLMGSLILITLDASTLFLSALLLSIVAIKTTSQSELISKITGAWFALSVAPALGVSFEEVSHFSNGFLIQVLFSFLFYVYFFTTKPSIIGRIYKEAKIGVGVSISSAISGFAAGILSAALWQAYLSISA
jgi:phosphatidylglycerophosphatase A